MNPFIKSLLILLAPLTTLLHAETEKEFAERVAKAWNSKNASEILALYGDQDATQSASGEMIDFLLKSNFTRVETTLLPPDPAASKSYVVQGKIAYPQSPIAGRVKVSFFQNEKSGNSTITSFSKAFDGKLSLTSPTVKNFDWTGEEMTSFDVTIASEDADDFIPEMVVVVEKFGHIDWLTIPPITSLPAHKIISIIVSPTPNTKMLKVEIGKHGGETIFNKTIDTSKGAIIPIESPTP